MITILHNEWTENNCSLGLLLIKNIHNASSPTFEHKKRELEFTIRETYQKADRQELKQLYPINAYVAHYKKFNSTYHVILQLESIIKGKTIPNYLPIVEAMFMSELKNLLLTAVHDFDKITPPLYLERSKDKEQFKILNGKDVLIPKGDLFIRDEQKIISSFIRGADFYSAVTPETNKALFTTYAPSSIDHTLIYQNLSDIEDYVRSFSPQAITIQKEVII